MGDDTKEALVKDEYGRIIGVDRTKDNGDGSSKTTHQDADFNLLTGLRVGSTTGVTTNKPDGTSTHHKR